MIDNEFNNKVLPLVVIAGPTASGKTSLAIKIAKSYGGEIVCADSRSVYKGMDIGTAKPSKAEQETVPHWGLDLVNPNETYSVANFKVYAINKIHEIRSRNKIPFLVGGTGLYVDAIIFDYEFGKAADINLRKKLNNMTLEQLQKHCIENNIELPENQLNKRYVIRSIERNGMCLKRRIEPLSDTIIVGIATDKAVLRSRIEQRIEQLFDDGVVNEAKLLGEIYGWEGEAFTGNVYRLAREYLDNNISIDEMKEKLITLDWRLAKRQMTWLRRNPYIKWGTSDELSAYLSDKLAKYN